MTLDRFRYALIFVLGMTLLTGCTSLQVRLGGGDKLAADAAGRIVAAYDLASLLAQADSIVADSLAENLPNGAAGERHELLRQRVKTVFATPKLVQALQEQLAQQALATRHVGMLADAADALETPLARRLHALQAKVGEASFASRYNAYVQQPQRADRDMRLQQLQVLMQAMGMIDLQDAFQVTLLHTVLNMRNTLARPALSPAGIKAELADNRRMLRSQLQKQLPPILLYVYRDVSDADLRHYVELQQSPALTWTNRTLIEAIRNVLAQAGRQLQASTSP